MNVVVKIQNVYNSILNGTEQKLVVVIGLYEKVFIGPLFFKQDAYECLTGEALSERRIEDATAKDIVIAAYELLKAYNMLKKGTLKTMAHWQFINGVTEEMLDGYKFEDDEDYYKVLKAEEEER